METIKTGRHKMLNYNTVTQKIGESILACYSFAHDAYDAGQPETQRELYAIADKIQLQLDALVKMETKQSKVNNSERSQ